MDATHMISDAFQELERDLERALDGLTPEELTWRPENWANPIGFTLWHVTRAEDMWIHRYGLDAPHIFEQDGWASKWGILPQDTGFGYEETTLDAFPTPPLEEMLAYRQDVRQVTLKYLDTLTPEALDGPLKTPHPRYNDYTVGRMLSHLACEIGEHVGHVRYLRGLQRGLGE